MDQRDLLISTDYPWDKIVYFAKTSSVLQPGSYSTKSIAHGLPYKPLIITQWSLYSDFRESYGEASGPVNSQGFLLVSTSSSSDSTNVTFGGSSGTSSAQTVYWRAFGLMPSNVDADAVYTFEDANSFIINSEYNYRKLLLSGMTGFSSTPSSTATIYHNLGYRPQVVAWSESATSDTVSCLTVGAPNIVGEDSTCAIYDDRIVFDRGLYTFASTAFHYRIYLDD